MATGKMVQRSWDFDGEIGRVTRPENLRDYDVILVNTSAGKDSQAMSEVVIRECRKLGILNRVVMVHADLGRVEWAGTRELAEEHARHYGVRFEVVTRKGGDLLDAIEQRGMWPANKQRFCTSYFKRDQVAKLMTRLVTEIRDGMPKEVPASWVCGECGAGFESLQSCPQHGPRTVPTSFLDTQFGAGWWKDAFGFTAAPTVPVWSAGRGSSYRVRVLNCMGLRADESPARAKKTPFEMDPTRSNGRRIVDNWLPIHDWNVGQVWACIKQAGTRVHHAYALGMPRLSCCFCIFSPESALLLAGYHNRDLLREYAALETKMGHTFREKMSLVQIELKLQAGHVPGKVQDWVM